MAQEGLVCSVLCCNTIQEQQFNYSYNLFTIDNNGWLSGRNGSIMNKLFVLNH